MRFGGYMVSFSEEFVKCPHCGAAIQKDSAYCPYCGEHIKPIEYPSELKESPSSKRLVIYLVKI